MVLIKMVGIFLSSVSINETPFELRMEMISMLMILAVMLCYFRSNLVPRVFRLPTTPSCGKTKDPGNEVASAVAKA